MEQKHIVLLSKDATLPEYFGPYGSKYTKTPNIDELAAKGTVFKHHYTAAPSTAMAFAAMFTGKYPYMMGYTDYNEVPDYTQETLFDKLEKRGYECHLLWSKNYIKMAEKYSKCYGTKTVHHDSMSFNLSCGKNGTLSQLYREYDYAKMDDVINNILKEVDTIEYETKPIFLWIHMPHCMLGGVSYGSDIEYFDKLAGELRKRFGDDNFFVTADHGHMNGKNGKFTYGFDVNENAIHIPLIAPKINGEDEILFNTSNIQLSEIILNHTVTKLPYVISDSAYSAQPRRKIAIIKNEFFYIYNKYTGIEELYDLYFDPSQNINLANSFFMIDQDRKMVADIRQIVLYPNWQTAKQTLVELRNVKNRLWEKGQIIERIKLLLVYKYNKVIFGIKAYFIKKKFE